MKNNNKKKKESTFQKAMFKLFSCPVFLFFTIAIGNFLIFGQVYKNIQWKKILLVPVVVWVIFMLMFWVALSFGGQIVRMIFALLSIYAPFVLSIISALFVIIFVKNRRALHFFITLIVSIIIVYLLTSVFFSYQFISSY